jgi:hypothetical protein
MPHKVRKRVTSSSHVRPQGTKETGYDCLGLRRSISNPGNDRVAPELCCARGVGTTERRRSGCRNPHHSHLSGDRDVRGRLDVDCGSSGTPGGAAAPRLVARSRRHRLVAGLPAGTRERMLHSDSKSPNASKECCDWESRLASLVAWENRQHPVLGIAFAQPRRDVHDGAVPRARRRGYWPWDLDALSAGHRQVRAGPNYRSARGSAGPGALRGRSPKRDAAPTRLRTRPCLCHRLGHHRAIQLNSGAMLRNRHR